MYNTYALDTPTSIYKWHAHVIIRREISRRVLARLLRAPDGHEVQLQGACLRSCGPELRLTDNQFSNLCGTVYRDGNVVFTPDGNSILSPVGNRVSVFDLAKCVTTRSVLVQILKPV